jgi:anti-anti-sigma factor
MEGAPVPPPVHFMIHATCWADHVGADAHGELDLATASVFAAELRPIVRRAAGDVVIDLRDLRFLDSSGATAIETVANDVAARGHTVILQNPVRAVQRTIDLCRLDASPGIEVDRHRIEHQPSPSRQHSETERGYPSPRRKEKSWESESASCCSRSARSWRGR